MNLKSLKLKENFHIKYSKILAVETLQQGDKI
jgi:hypothetical protein